MNVAFSSIDGGKLEKKFQMALAQIGYNIMDPNTDPKAVREVTINLKFKPTPSGSAEVEYTVKPKLAGFAKEETLFLIEQDIRTGRVAMSEYGNNRPRVAEIKTGREQGQDPEAGQEFDPETGEIYVEPRRGPIDLRAGAGQ